MAAKKAAKKVPARGAVKGPVIHLESPEVAEESGRAAPKPPKAPKMEREDPEDVKRRQAAFDSTYVWDEGELFPFSISRESLFAQLRLAMGAPPLGMCLGDQDAFLAEAMRILYLCCHEPRVWQRLRVDPLMLQERIDAWAEANIAPHRYGEVTVLAMRIYADAHENRHEPAPLPTKGHGDDLGN